MMPFREKILFRYLCHAPIPLAIERSIESRLYQGCRMERPILDVGCGDGLFARMVFAIPLDTGIDPDLSEIETARQNRGYRELIQTAGDRIPKPDGSYKTILSNSVLEHIPNLMPVLAEIRRLLDDNGRFYFTVPSAYFEVYAWVAQLFRAMGLYTMAKFYQQFYNRFWKHYHCYSLEGWNAVARQAGFSVVQSFTYNPPRTCLVNDILAPLAMPGFIRKRRTGRWVACPELRRTLLRPFYSRLANLVSKSGPCQDGGLVFMALRKN